MPGEFTATEQLGYLRGAAEAQMRETAELKAMIKDQGKEAAAARSDLARRLGEVERKVKMFEPIAEDFNRWRERGLGALMVVGVFASAVTALVGAFWTKIAAWLSRAFTGG